MKNEGIILDCLCSCSDFQCVDDGVEVVGLSQRRGGNYLGPGTYFSVTLSAPEGNKSTELMRARLYAKFAPLSLDGDGVLGS